MTEPLENWLIFRKDILAEIETEKRQYESRRSELKERIAKLNEKLNSPGEVGSTPADLKNEPSYEPLTDEFRPKVPGSVNK